MIKETNMTSRKAPIILVKF